MSQENMEIVRGSFSGFERGGLDGLAEYWHPEIDWRALEGAPDDVGVMIGRDAVRAYAQDWLDHFDAFRIDVDELVDAGEQVVALQRISGRAKGSGVATELRYAVVYTVRDGAIVRGREYATREEALEAVGLSE